MYQGGQLESPYSAAADQAAAARKYFIEPASPTAGGQPSCDVEMYQVGQLEFYAVIT